MEDSEVKKIVMGIPHTGMFHWQTFTSVLGLLVPQGYALNPFLVGSCLIYDARETIVQHARKQKADYILFMDSDMVPPSDMLLKMTQHLMHDEVDAVTAMIFKRKPPYQPCFYTDIDYDLQTMKPKLIAPIEWEESTGLMQIEGAGLACCMVKTSTFDKLGKPPYFFPLPNMGEDLTFCMKMKTAGLRLYVDLSIDCGHISTMPIYKKHFVSCHERDKQLKTNSFTCAETEGMVQNV